MGNRNVPFEPTTACDGCGAMGAFDFMGDLLCPGCLMGNPPNMQEMYAQRNAIADSKEEKP